MLGIKSENTHISGKEAIQSLNGIERRSQGNFSDEELSRISQEQEILKRFNVKWEK